MRSDETTASDYDENTQEFDEDDDDGDFPHFKWELHSQNYYWGNTNKEILAKAMQVTSKNQFFKIFFFLGPTNWHFCRKRCLDPWRLYTDSAY